MARKRGRPIGSGIKSDDAALEKVADKMVQTGVCFTRAYKELHPCSWTENIIRRVQKKWKVKRDALITDARRRLEVEQQRASVAVLHSCGDRHTGLRAMQDATMKMAALGGTGAFGALSEFTRKAQAMINHPAVMNARRFQERFAELNRFADLTGIKEMRWLQDTSTFRAFREQRKAFEALGL